MKKQLFLEKLSSMDIYNPLDKRNLGKSIADALMERGCVSIVSIERFEGAGIYALYYNGGFAPYRVLSEINESDWGIPIYVGKAIPSGSRKGVYDLDIEPGPVLYKRLKEHRKSLENAVNLNPEDFFCRYILLDDIWIPLGETLVIQKTEPLWNVKIEGFGIHDPGSGRKGQKRSLWDTLHPGRNFAEKLERNELNVGDITRAVIDYLENKYP
jgi:hypothetical protein